jgi:hypothetical protein
VRVVATIFSGRLGPAHLRGMTWFSRFSLTFMNRVGPGPSSQADGRPRRPLCDGRKRGSDVVLRPPESWGRPRAVAHGRHAVQRAVAEYRDSLGQHVEIEEQIDPGDRVVSRCRSDVRGAHSGVQGELRLSMVHTFRNGS